MSLDPVQAEIWLFIGLFAAAIPLVALARRSGVSYPIVLVLGGLLLGFVPGLPQVALNPDLVLVIFLPPLLYWESINAPTDEMRANAKPIWFLAIGLVVATTAAVAGVAHALIPQLGWPMAFVLGAIVAPTDELASEPVLERLRMPRRLTAIIEGESLLNDASSLIIYAAAITATVTGVFEFWRTLGQFFLSGFGGVAVGLVAGRLAVLGWRRIKDTELQLVISFTVPFLAYVSAQWLGLSGVLAVVYMGIYVNGFTPKVLTATARIQASGFWNTLVFFANALLFLLVGLQLHAVTNRVLAENSWLTILWYALVVNATILGTRFAWCLIQEYVPLFGRTTCGSEPNWREAVITAWSGLRGAVSLAAALAIPLTVASGLPTPQRSLVVFLTFSAILVTLVGGGLTLPLVIRMLRVPPAPGDGDELKLANQAMNQAALKRLEQLEHDGAIGEPDAAVFRTRFERRLDPSPQNPQRARHAAAERALLDAQRAALIDLRAQGKLDNTTLRRFQRWLDVSEVSIPPIRLAEDE